WEQELKIQAQERAEVMAVGMAQKLAVGIAEEMAVGMAEEMAEERVEEMVEERTIEVSIETARKLLNEAIAPQTVARCTGLPLEQVEQLLRQSTAEA
ncbi:MAG: hypothetical protein NC219_10640, partial [Prevotella sp.]|nr:hypothetical protein [Prevotella sp.]